MPEQAQAELITRAKRGDLDAFEALTQAHGDRIRRLAYRFSWDADDADDIAQEAFIRAFRYLRGFRDGSDFGPWLSRIAVNAALAHRKRRDRDRQPATPPPPSNPLPDRIGTSIRVQDEVSRLPARQQAAIALFEFEGFSVGETAAAMGCSAGTVKRHLHRARQALRAKLADLIESETDPGGAGHEL